MTNLILKHFYAKTRQWRQIIFAIVYQFFAPFIEWSNIPTRKRLFSQMKNLESMDPVLRKEGPGVLRVLEVGLGPCSNLPFYPEGTRLITLDPNTHFSKSVRDKLKKYSHVKVEKHVVGFDEDMHEIPDASVDVVVATYLLCSVNDLQQILSEFHRVLVPGGKYYFYEHHGFSRTYFLFRWIQYLIQPLWSIIGDTCCLTNSSLEAILQSKFTVEDYHSFWLYKLFLLVLWPHTMGVAVK